MAIEIGKIKESLPTPLPTKPVKVNPEDLKMKENKLVLEEERIYRKGVVTMKDIIAPASFEVTPKFLKLSGVFVRTLFIITYPRHIGVGWSSPLINLNKTFDVAMFFYPIKPNIILKQLQKKVGVFEAKIFADREKGAPRDPMSETALQDIEQLRDSITQGIEHFFQFAFYVTIYATTEDDLEKFSEEVETLFGSKLIYTKGGYYQTEQGFNSTLPLGNDELMITYNMNTSPIAASFPFISSELSSDNGILYGINRHNNSLILFDRFSLQNANSVVFATSGAGKSYSIKLEILRSLMMGTDVIVIDPEMEYKDLSDAVGGTFINVSLASDAKVNPFDLPRAVGEGTKVDDIIRSAVITLKGLLRIMIGVPIGEKGNLGFTPVEDSILDRALIETFAKKDITPALTDLSTVEPPIMQDLQDVLEGMDGAAEIVARLTKYTDGTFSGLLNSPTTVAMNNQLVVFSVRDLEDELRAVGIYSIVNYIWNVVRSERKKRILVIDEAWWLMQQEDSAKFIFALVKRARKYFLGVTTITQDVNDFLRSQYGQAIVTNSAMQLLMKQSASAIDSIQQTFNLTDGEKFLLLESGIGEGIFFAGQKHAAIKIVASYSEDKLVTTNPEQLLKLEKEDKDEEAKRAEEERVAIDASKASDGIEETAIGAENFDMEKDARELTLGQNASSAKVSDSVVPVAKVPDSETDITAKKVQENAVAALLASESEGKAEANKILDSLSS